MYRWIAVVALGMAVSACTHYTNLTPDDFNRGKASRLTFVRDNYDCQVDAAVAQNMIDGSDPHGTYNNAYVACMKKRGYQTTNIDLVGFGG